MGLSTKTSAVSWLRKEGGLMAGRPRKDREELEAPAPERLLSVEGVAEWFGVSRSKLFEMMHEHDFPVIVITEKLIRFDPNSLYRWALKRQRIGKQFV